MTANDARTATATEPALMTAEQAADFCAMALSTWYKKASAGKVPRPVKIDSLVRWRRDELRDWIAAGCPVRSAWDTMRNKKHSKSA